MSDNEVMDVSSFLNLHLKEESLEARNFSVEKIDSNLIDANDNGFENNNQQESVESAALGLDTTAFSILALAASIKSASSHYLNSLRHEEPADGSPINSTHPEVLADPDLQALQQSSQEQLEYLASTDLPEHMDVCRFCFKLLPKRKMSIHLRIHTGERPFNCDFCSKTFARSDKLKMHMRIHTGERPYRCFCGKGFARQDKCKRHISTHPHSLILEQQQNIISPHHDSMLSNVIRQVKMLEELQQQEESGGDCPEEQQQENIIMQQSEGNPVQTSLSLSVALPCEQSKPNLFQLDQTKTDTLLPLPRATAPPRQRLLLPKPPMMPLQAASTEQVYPGPQEEDILCKHCDCTFRSRRAYLSHVKGHTKKDVFKCPCGREFKSAKWLSNHQKREGCLIHNETTNPPLDSSAKSFSVSKVINVNSVPPLADNLQTSSLISNEDKSLMSSLPINVGAISAELPIQEANDNNAPTLFKTLTLGADQGSSFPVLVSGDSSPTHEEEQDEDLCHETSPPFPEEIRNGIVDKEEDSLQQMAILEALSQNNQDSHLLNDVPISGAAGKNNALLRLISKIKRKKRIAQEEDKRYPCDFCTKTFSKKHKMHIHRRMHTGEKPYVCKVCGKAFSRKDHMIKHMNIHYKYRKQYGETDEAEKMGEDGNLYSGDMPSCSTSTNDNPVLSALSGVSIMQLEQSELQTKLAALSALAKAFEIQKKGAVLAETPPVDVTSQLLSAALVKPNNYSTSLGSTSFSTSNSLPENPVPNTFPIDLLQKLNKAKMKKKYVPKTLLVSNSGDEGAVNGKYKCSQCDRSYNRSHQFLAHSRTVHKVHGNSKFACGVCGVEVWTRRRFENHVVTHSDAETEDDAVTNPTKRTKQDPNCAGDRAEVLMECDEKSNEVSLSDAGFGMDKTDFSADKHTLTESDQLQVDMTAPVEAASTTLCFTNENVSLENCIIPENSENSEQAVQADSDTPKIDDTEAALNSDNNLPLCVDDYLSILAAAGPSVKTSTSIVDGENGAPRSLALDNESSATAASSSSEDDGGQSDSPSSASEAFATASAMASANGEALATVQCSICDKMVYEYNYHRHLAKHTKVNMCTICGTMFTRRSDVTRHMKLHEREKQFHCEGCGMSFAKKDKLTLHSRRCTAGKGSSYQNLDFASLFVADA